MPARNNTIFSVWTLTALLLVGAIAWFAYLYRHGIDLPSFSDLFQEGSSEYWSADRLAAHLREKGLQVHAVPSSKQEPTRQWTLYLFLTDVQQPKEVADYFDAGGPDEELPEYHGVRVEKCLSNLAAGARASSLGANSFAWGSYVFFGYPALVNQIRTVLH